MKGGDLNLRAWRYPSGVRPTNNGFIRKGEHMYNKKDMKKLEEKLKQGINIDGTFKEPWASKLLDDVTGPTTGMIYEYDEQRLHLADGYVFDSDGNIVRRDSVTGPNFK